MSKPICKDPEDNKDMFFRYKRPELQMKAETKGGFIINADDLAKSLHVKSSDLLKFMAKKLGSGCNPKRNSIQSGKSRAEYEEALQAFINQKVLCAKCGLPERNEKNICKACGFKNV